MESLSGHTWQILVPAFLGVVLAGFAYEFLIRLPVATFLSARGAGLSVVWPQFAALILIGAVLFVLSLARFRKTLAAMA